MDNGKTLDFMKHVDFVKKSSLNEKLAETEIRLGEARLAHDSNQVNELEKARAKIIAELNPIINHEMPYPEPLAESAYHGLVGEIVRAIEPHSEADPVALLMNLLTGFGNVIGNSSSYRVGAEKHHFRLFVGFCGDTAKGRKGSSWNPIKFLFEMVEPEWAKGRIQTGLSSGEGLIWHVRDEIWKKVQNKKTLKIEEQLSDEGVADKRLLIVEGELSQTLKVLNREGNTLSPVIRNSWDSGDLQLLTKNSPIRASGAHVSIIGHITRSELVRNLNEVERANGFANRFLWFCVDRSKVLPFGGDFNAIDMHSLSSELKNAVEFGKTAGEVTWSEETRDLWEAIYPELSKGKAGIIGAITARAEAQVVRLASIYALLDRSNLIEPEHLQAAVAICTYAESSVKYIFQQATGEPIAEQIREALSKNPQGMSRTDINNALGRNLSSDRINEALDLLEVNNLAFSKQIETIGRPREIWFLKQDMYELNEKSP